MSTLATPANMRAFEQAHPSRDGVDENGQKYHVEGVRAVAYSPTTLEEYSATSGDYWHLADDQAVPDANGEPMLLVVATSGYVDAMSSQRI